MMTHQSVPFMFGHVGMYLMSFNCKNSANPCYQLLVLSWKNGEAGSFDHRLLKRQLVGICLPDVVANSNQHKYD